MSDKKDDSTPLVVIDGEGADGVSTAEQSVRPLFSVIDGNPTDEELGALTAVLSKLESEAQQARSKERRRPINKWGDVSESLDRPITYNPCAFINSRLY